MTRFFFFAAAPLAMLACAWGALVWLRIVPSHALAATAYGAMALAGLGCWRFKRTRAVVPLGLLALTLWFSGQFDAGVGSDPLGQVSYALLALLLPLNWSVAVLAGDRGLFGRVPLILIFFATLQILVVLFIATGAFGAYEAPHAAAMQAWGARLSHVRLLPGFLDAWTPLPQPALLCALVCVLGLLGRAAYSDSPMDGGLAVALAGAMGVLHSAGTPAQAAALATGAALACVAPLAQDSYRMAFLDELTGLPARRSLLADMQALGGHFAIAMADVDHFKKFNDTYGHDTGDEVLRMVARQLATVAGGGRAYRYGGEEFTVLFPRKGAAEALPCLDAVREAIAGAGFVVRKRRPTGAKGAKGAAGRRKGAKGDKAQGGVTVSLTISMGVAEPGMGGAVSPAEVLKQADKALYKAKKKGRNRVEKG